MPKKRSIPDKIQQLLRSQYITSELTTAKSNQEMLTDDFESYVALLDSVREPKQYDWMSDIRLPDFISRHLTQSSMDVGQYFQTRDFVEVYLEDQGDEAKACAAAAKECVNRTLNQKHLYHYQKFVRAKSINNLVGRCYLMPRWEQKMRGVIVDWKTIKRPKMEKDEEGNEFPVMTYDEAGNQIPVMEDAKLPVMGEEPVYDRFNYDALDPRNVFTSNEYVYSLQQKRYIWVRAEASLHELWEQEEDMGYFNLDKLDEMGAGSSTQETETSRDTYNKSASFTEKGEFHNPMFDIYTRFGKAWSIVTKRDPYSEEPIEAMPGLDEEGKPKDDAEFIEVVMVFAVSGSAQELIGYKPQPYKDASGAPYRNIIRGLCYVHPTDDGGVGDGKFGREIQIAIDDTFNVSNDRVLLATLPTVIATKNSNMDNNTIRIEPRHVIEEESQGDIRELKLSDNIQGALNQIGMLTNAGDKVSNIFPTTMGQLPGDSSTTATAVAATGGQANLRSNYKSLTFENTALTELYWMILQMTMQFAKPETGYKLMGEKVYFFDPKKDYYYKPVSASIETEASKSEKIKNWTTILQSIIGVQHPDAVKAFNFIMTEISTLMGKEYANFSGKLLNEQVPMQQGTQGSPPAVTGTPPSNQNGMPMSQQEQMVRGAMNAA